jgi:SpoVK/Ycf46/Vps4 family AAA+-type ATPase
MANPDRPISENYIEKDKKYYIEAIKEVYSKNYRIPRKPVTLTFEPSQNNIREQNKQVRKSNQEEILSPLDEVFFDQALMDELVVRTSIPQLLEGQDPIYRGVILYGPPGTGKSEFQRAACRVYENAGAYAKQVSTSAINSCFVGKFAKNLEEELQMAQQQGDIRGLPSLLCFDEGSTLAETAKQGATSVSKHYQEAIDTLKRFIGNESGSKLVLAISTNMLPEDFEDAMTREGRLTTFFIGYPSEMQLGRMWRHFLKKYNVLELTEKQSQELASLTHNTMGAFIEEFARGYITQRRHTLLLERGYSSLIEALKKGVSFAEKDVQKSITFPTLKNDLMDYLKKYELRNGQKKENERTEIGFHALSQNINTNAE